VTATMRGRAPKGCVWLPEAAVQLGVEPSTLRKWRVRRTGPDSFKHAGRVCYEQVAIDSYLAACKAADSRSNRALAPTARPKRPHLPALPSYAA